MPHLRNRYLLLIDGALLPLAAVTAFAVRFEGFAWPAGAVAFCVLYALLATPLKLVAMFRLGVYGRLWRYASIRELETLCVAGLAAVCVGLLAGAVFVPVLAALLDPLVDPAGVAAISRVPLAALVIDSLLTGIVVIAPRILPRLAAQPRRRATDGERRVIVAGAGAAGSLIVRELLTNAQLRCQPVAFVDDDVSKHHRVMHGVPVGGSLDELGAVARRYGADELIIAMPSVPGHVVRRVVQNARAAELPTRTVPGLYELIEGRKAVSALRKVAIEDLLSRDPVRGEPARPRALVAGRTVMITGAGGSIGSELCRQLVRLDPERIVAVGRGENSIFELLQEFRHAFPHVRIDPVVADVRHEARMERIFERFRPDVVFHAAAHKHVPLMEEHVGEAVLNNVLGTRVVVELAERYGAERFVLISSDKAVRPSSVMGATKRLAEGVVQEVARRTGHGFVAVRFGNVLGSRGSVIPTFMRQIQAGGPLTITHPEMVRYFMTIPEAVQLVLEAGSMGESADVFVLDMGEPVRVVDLARDLIRLSGLEEGQDIEIKFTGIRPGEKLYEELFFSAENAAPTSHPKILRARSATIVLDGSPSVDDLIAMAQSDATNAELRAVLKSLVPEYSGVADVQVRTLPAVDADRAPSDERPAELDRPAAGACVDEPVAAASIARLERV